MTTASRWFGRAAVATFVAVLLVGVVAAANHGGTPPNDDEALIDLQVFDVGAHTPLVGSYERFGGNQPGPLVFLLLAAPYRIIGEGPAGLGVGAVLLTAACVAGCVVIAVRRGGLLLGVWTGLLLAILLLARGAELLTSPWGPNVLLTAFALLVLLIWEYACGTDGALPFAAATATLLAQSWVGSAIFVAALGGLAFGIALTRLVRHRRGPAPRAPGTFRALILTGVVLGVLWLPPVVEQFTRDPGNLTELAAIRHDAGPSLGLRDGYRAVALEFGIDAPWLTGKIPTPPFSPTVALDEGSGVPVALIVFVAAALIAARRRARSANWLNLVVSITILAAIVSRALVFGDLFVWIAEPDRVVGMLCWYAAGYSLVAAAPFPAQRRVARLALPIITAGLVVVAVALAINTARATNTVDRPSRAAALLADQALAARPELENPVLVTSTARATDRSPTTCCAPVVASILTRAGFDVVVERDQANRYGPHRARPGRARSELLITSFRGEGAPRRAGYRLVGTADQLGRAQRARLRRIDERLTELVGPDPSLPELAEAQSRNPEARRLLTEKGRIGEGEQLALYRRD